MVPRSTVHTFTERIDLMHQAVSFLSLSREFRDLPRSIALWGIGGSGKSQLALRFIEKHRDNYTTIIWIDAQSPETATRSYSEAFERLNVDYPQHIIDQSRNDGDLYDQQGISTANNWIIHSVKEWLENTPCNWLVVIDNADNLTWIHDIMPKGRMGSLIITSRDRMVYRAVNHAIHVDKMSTEEALDLLLRSANIVSDSRQQHVADPVQQKSQEHQAFLIVEELGYFALAIDLAGAYISQHDFVREDLSYYLKFLEHTSVALLGSKALQDAGDYDHTVATVWETSIAAINQTSPASVHLLTFLAYLSTTPVDDRLLAEASMSKSQRSNLHPTWRILLEKLLLAVDSRLQRIIVYLISVKIILPWKPHLQGRNQTQSGALIALRFLAVGFVATVLIIMRVYIRRHGNSVVEDRAVWMSVTIDLVLSTGFVASITTLYKNSIDTSFNLSIIDMLLMPFVLSMALNGFEVYKANLDGNVALRSSLLLEQLDFSYSNRTQFSTVARNIHIASESAKRDLFVVAGICLLPVIYAIFLITTRPFRGARLVSTVRACCPTVPRPMKNRIGLFEDSLLLGRRIPKPFMNTFTYLISAIYLVVILVTVIPTLVAKRMSMKPSSFHVSPALVNNLLTTTLDGQWNRQAYSEAMVPLTRFSLIHRDADAAYSMHVLVRWWARNRLPFEMQQAWTRETERFISMVYNSPTCSVDPFCQQILVSQLLEIATSGIGSLAVMGKESRFSLRKITNMIDRSLTMVGKSHGILPDD